MISADTVLQAEHIVDTSNMVDMLIAGYRTSNRGRPPARTKLRQLLIAMYLCPSPAHHDAHRRVPDPD